MKIVCSVRWHQSKNKPTKPAFRVPSTGENWLKQNRDIKELKHHKSKFTVQEHIKYINILKLYKIDITMQKKDSYTVSLH